MLRINIYHSISSSNLNLSWYFGSFVLMIAISFSTLNTFFIVRNDINKKYTGDLLFPLRLVLWMYYLAWRIQKFTSNWLLSKTPNNIIFESRVSWASIFFSTNFQTVVKSYLAVCTHRTSEKYNFSHNNSLQTGWHFY